MQNKDNEKFELTPNSKTPATQFFGNAIVGDGLADQWAEILGLKVGKS